MDWQERLISLYLFICKEFKEDLALYTHRESRYSNLNFSDEEVVTIFLYGLLDKKTELKKMYEHADDYWHSWFLHLLSYTAFVQRLNRISEVFAALVHRLYEQLPFDFDAAQTHLIDSMPIILAQRTRRFDAKVAREVCSPDGYCVTKRLNYYGVKLHAVACYQKGTLPIPAYIQITPAHVFDGKVYDDIRPLFRNKVMIGDKAYQKQMVPIFIEEEVTLYTSVKKREGQAFLDSADKRLSFAISSMRQPIESLFNWIEEKTKIQMASKVRPLKGLMVHIYGRLAAALFLLKNKMGSVCS